MEEGRYNFSIMNYCEPQPAKKKVVVEDLDPPAGKPKIETPTHTGDSGSSSSGNMWVPPALSLIHIYLLYPDGDDLQQCRSGRHGASGL